MKLDDFQDEVCAHCGKGFETTRTTQKFCCTRCRELSAIAFACVVNGEERRRARAGRTCPGCGVVFDAMKTAHQVYCTENCSQRARRRAKKAAMPPPPPLLCRQCDNPITDAKARRALFCAECRRERHRTYGQRCRARKTEAELEAIRKRNRDYMRAKRARVTPAPKTLPQALPLKK